MKKKKKVRKNPTGIIADEGLLVSQALVAAAWSYLAGRKGEVYATKAVLNAVTEAKKVLKEYRGFKQ